MTENIFVLILLFWVTGCGLVEQEELEPMKSDRELALLADCRAAEDAASMTHKFPVCHTPAGIHSDREPFTMLLSAAARDFHLEHGDTPGGCGCEEVDEDDQFDAAAPDTSASAASDADSEALTGSGDYCDANQYSCEHNWGCPEQHICDLGCCVYVVAWEESVEGDAEETGEDETADAEEEGQETEEPTDSSAESPGS